MSRRGKRDCTSHVRRCFLSPSDFRKTRTRLELTLGYFSCVSGKFSNHIAAPLITVFFFSFFISTFYFEKRKIFCLCSAMESFVSDLFCPSIYINLSLLIRVWNSWNLIFSLNIKWWSRVFVVKQQPSPSSLSGSWPGYTDHILMLRST